MADSSWSISPFLETVRDLGAPFMKSWAYGQDRAADVDAAEQMAKYRASGGTGPIDAYGASLAPSGTLGLLFGITTADSQGRQRLNVVALVVYGILLLVAWLIIRRR